MGICYRLYVNDMFVRFGSRQPLKRSPSGPAAQAQQARQLVLAGEDLGTFRFRGGLRPGCFRGRALG
jgi:hypothetical protein